MSPKNREHTGVSFSDEILATHAHAFHEVTNALSKSTLTEGEVIDMFKHAMRIKESRGLRRLTVFTGKPVRPTITREMIAKITQEPVSFGPYSFFPVSKYVEKEGTIIAHLSKREVPIFHPLIFYPGKVLRTALIIESYGWSNLDLPAYNAVKTYVNRIRNKLGETNSGSRAKQEYPHLQTIPRYGYVLCPVYDFLGR